MEIVRKGLKYIVMLNELEEDNIFKICAEFWFDFSDHILKTQLTKGGEHQ